MKNKTQIVLIGMVCALFSLNVHAQDANNVTVYKDTILMVPCSNCKIFLVGYGIKKLAKYTRFDTLKTMLIADVEVAGKNPSYPADSKTTHYFVARSGKRRLKAEGGDYPEAEIDIKKEKQSLEQDLPPYLYIIHDFKTGYECFIYLKAPSDLKELSSINFSEALLFVENNKGYKHRYRYDIKQMDNKWIENDTVNFRYRKDFAEIGPLFSLGGALIGSQLSPVLCADINMTISNKYAIPVFTNRFCISGYTFTQVNNFEITNLYPVVDYTDKLLYRLSSHHTASAHYYNLGLEYGWFQSKTDGWLNKAQKFGFAVEDEKMNLSFDVIWDRNKNKFYGLTVAVPFFR